MCEEGDYITEVKKIKEHWKKRKIITGSKEHDKLRQIWNNSGKYKQKRSPNGQGKKTAEEIGNKTKCDKTTRRKVTITWIRK